MPTVPAAGYPTGPEAPPQIDPRLPVDDYQHIQATPEAFGAQVGGALKDAGRTLEQGASEFAQAAIARQELTNQIVSDQKQSEYVKGANNILFGDPSAPPGSPESKGLYGLHGEEAANAGPKINQALDDLEAKTRATLTNSRQIIDFNSYTRRFRAVTAADIGRHLDTEAHTYGAAVQQANQQLAIQNGNTYYLDPNRLQMEFTNGEKGAIGEAVNAGAPPDGPIAMAKLNDFHNRFVVSIVDRYLSANDPGGAKAWLGTHAHLVTDSAAMETMNNRIRLGLVQKGAREITANTMSPGGAAPGGGGGPMDAGAVDAAQRIATTLKSRGYSDAAITGALNNVMGESSFNPKSTGAAGEQGYFQFNPGSHLPLFTDKYKGDWSPEAQANYVADWVDKNMPGYKGATDPAAATRDFLRGFEAPKDQSDAAVAARVAHTAAVTRLLAGGGRTAAGGAPGAGVPPGTIDKTADAGFGQKFGPLESPQGMIIHHTGGGETVDAVINTFKQTGYPAQFVIDRQGKIYQTLPDGYQGQHIRDSYGPLGAGKTNANMEGVEIIANNDGDVLPVQEEAAARLVAARAAKWGYDPRTSVYGHGEVNPGHKEADEGMSTVTRIRNGSLPVTAPGPQVASAAPTTMTDAGAGGSAAARAAGGAPIAIGDSIARGFQKSGGAAGTGKDLDATDTTVHASGGRPPSTILRYLDSQPDGSLNGQPVIFSTGVSNGPAEIGLIPKQLAELWRMGAGTISVVGVGTKAGEEGGKHYDLNKYNAQIEQAAKAAGATFLGGLPAVVHPAASYYAGAMPKAAATGKPQTVPEGVIIYGPNGQQMKNVGGKLVDVTPRTPPPEM